VINKILVGTYQLGLRNIKVFADPNTASGSVIMMPENKGVAEVNVGIAKSWAETVSTFLHEAFELSFIDLNGRYSQSPGFCQEASDFIFLVTHNQFSDAGERVSELLVKALPALEKIYKKNQKK